MSVRVKFLTTIFGIILCLSFVFFAIISPVLNEKFEHHELKAATRKVKQVQAAFNFQFQSLNILVQDMANWHDTYLFVVDQADNKLAANIMRNSFVNSARIDVFLTFNADQNLTHGVTLNENTNKIENVSNEVLQTIMLHKHFLSDRLAKQHKMEVVQFGDKFLAIAASSIYNSKEDNSYSGTLVLGRYLDENEPDHIKDMTQYQVDFHPISSGQPEVVEANQILHSSSSFNPFYVKSISDEVIKGYTHLNDLSGKGVLMMVVTIDRLLHRKHHDNLPFLFKSIILCSLVFGIICFLFIDIIVSRRLSAITSDIKKIEEGGLDGSRIKESKVNDELGKLTVSINRMLEANEHLAGYKEKNKKLESVATFAAGATHELATPLSTIAIASGEILHDLIEEQTDKEELYDDIFLIREQVHRCKYILGQMAANTGGHMGEELISFSIDQLVEETLVQFRQSEVKQLQVENGCGNKLISMPFHSLCRVLRGLLRNSIEASENGKSILLSCDNDDTHLIFVVRDQGAGMDDHTLKHALVPFFSTKEPGKNLGLGLYLAQALASRFKGELNISSTLDSGTTISLSFAKENIYV